MPATVSLDCGHQGGLSACKGLAQLATIAVLLQWAPYSGPTSTQACMSGAPGSTFLTSGHSLPARGVQHPARAHAPRTTPHAASALHVGPIRINVRHRSVDQPVFNLRHKLPADEGGDTLIQSVRGIGY